MSDRLRNLDDAPRPVDPVFRDAIRVELLATVTATPSAHRISGPPTRRRSWRRPAGLTAAVLAGLIGGGTVAVASGIVVLPGADLVEPRSAALDVEHTGTATVELGTPPRGATHVELAFTCLDAGTFTIDGASISCAAAAAPSSGGTATGTGAAIWSQPLAEVAAGITVSTEPESRWLMTRTFSAHTSTEWGVNANGDTYGVQRPDGSTPDLIAVETTTGEAGYAYATELTHAPDFASPQEALAWQEEGSRTPPVAVYNSDGTTVVGTFDNGSSR